MRVSSPLIIGIALLLFCQNMVVEAVGGVPRPRLSSLRDLSRYAGTYPCTNGILNAPILLRALSLTLGHDFPAYREHMRASGCGPIELWDDFIVMDVSQLHVGGYSSLIFVRARDGVMFLFWLKERVLDKKYRIYGPRPVPIFVMLIIEHSMNETWGHVARFTARGETLEITAVR